MALSTAFGYPVGVLKVMEALKPKYQLLYSF